MPAWDWIARAWTSYSTPSTQRSAAAWGSGSPSVAPSLRNITVVPGQSRTMDRVPPSRFPFPPFTQPDPRGTDSHSIHRLARTPIRQVAQIRYLSLDRHHRPIDLRSRGCSNHRVRKMRICIVTLVATATSPELQQQLAE